MADVSKITASDNVTYNLKDTYTRNKLIYPVKGTQTASTGLWTGAIDLDELYDGLTIAYYLPYATPSGSNSSLNLTLSNGTTTGAINCYYTGTTRITTHYAAGSVILLTYYSKGSISVSGTPTTQNRWLRCDYSNNTWRKVQLEGVDKLTTSTSSGPLNFSAGSNMTITENDGTFTFSSTGGGGSGTTYSFQNGTNGFTVTPYESSPQTVTVTPKIDSTDTSSKMYLIGAASQGTAVDTYSDDEVYATSGVLTTKSVRVGGTAATMQYNSTTQAIEFIFS